MLTYEMEIYGRMHVLKLTEVTFKASYNSFHLGDLNHKHSVM